MTTMKPLLGSPQKWKPRPYMKKAVKFLLEHAAAGLFLDPGLGKTAITLAAIKFLKEQGVLDRVLVIAPLRPCYSVWPAEIKKWKDFRQLTYEILHGPKKDEALEREADIYIINPEGLPWLLGTKKNGNQVDVTTFREHGFDTLVVDELSKFKSTRTSRFKMIKKILGLFARRWGLTGSPASNGLMDLFGQCYVLDEGRSLGKYITRYRMDYFYQVDQYLWVPQPGAEEQIYERLAPLVLRMSADDYLELPRLLENNIRVEIPDKAMKIYSKLEDDLIAQVENHTVVATNAASASTKCRQVASGGIYVDPEIEELIKIPKGKRKWVDLHTAKVDALAELVDELQGSPLLVAYDFKHDLERIRERLGRDVPYIGGGVSTKKSTQLEREWNMGMIPVLLAHPASVAHGLNLQESGRHVCWHSLTWDYELYDQFIRRVYRQGNKSSNVTVHHILARDTIDEAILGALRGKKKGQDALFDALRELQNLRS